jgi:lipopolysaccharide/colanic/teichoic acid biosynthesis glycosyltransferase
MINRRFYVSFLKPVFDFIAALLGLIVASPFIFFISVWLAIVNKRSPYYLQRRPGKDGKIFKLIKFRTMADKFDDKGNLLPDRQRITKAGHVVRSLSMDELPQLINVLKGDMSLVGPRPLLEKYLPLYNDFQARRHEVKPGITGWTQVNGRNALSWEQKFEKDVWYVDHISLLLDLKILLKTVQKVVKREGVYSSAQNTMTPFKGNS